MASIPVFEQDLFADEFIRNPYPAYASMRKLGPVVWLPSLGNFALTQHHEVQAALRDNYTFISGDGVAADTFGCDHLQGNTVASDGQKHTELRRAMAAPLLPGELVGIKDTVQSAANQLIDDLLKRGQFDAIADLAQHLPLTIVTEMVGLPDFGKERMLQWAAAAFDVLGVQNERGKQALDTIADMRKFIQQDATRENLKPGSWTRRIHELVDQGALPCEHAPFAIRDYINPSLDTTISATGELIWQLANNPQQWEKLKQHPDLVKNAVNEAIRLSTPIRSFSRHTSKDTSIAGHKIARGSRVMMLFASANRDETVFSNPDQFDITRNPRTHLGFGSGVHMCVGMHLAQLEMESLLHAMITRVGPVTVGKPTIKMNNTIRAYATLPCQFEPETRDLTATSTGTSNPASVASSALLSGIIKSRTVVAKNIVCLTIAPIDQQRHQPQKLPQQSSRQPLQPPLQQNGTQPQETQQPFPVADAGAHITIHLPTGMTRQYSLTGDLHEHSDTTERTYTIAVLKTDDSRGGSQWMHNNARPGSVIRFSNPQNHFPLRQADGKVYLFAGGIGLTPLLSMAWELHRQQRDFSLHIYVRSTEHLPFADDLASWPFRANVTVHINNHRRTVTNATSNESALDKVFTCANPTSTSVYMCGPAGFMELVEKQTIAAGIAERNIFRELFGAEIDPDGEPFTLVAKKSGRTLRVPADKSILTILREADIAVETSCENGVCGSCLTSVLEGKPDHRDMVQTETEKSTDAQIAVCCSRSLSRRLTLDI